MYEDYYRFRRQPFSPTPDPEFLYTSDPHQQALEQLLRGIQRREGMLLLTGDVGTGKTTTTRALLRLLDTKVFTALVLNPFVSEDELLRVLLQDFGVVSDSRAL
jgi:general secretion pathway protein A